MSALYWDDVDCTPESRAIAHEDVVHQHFTSERAACLAFLGYRAQTPAELGMPPPQLRYRCIRGPRGIVRGVILTDVERAQILRGELAAV